MSAIRPEVVGRGIPCGLSEQPSRLPIAVVISGVDCRAVELSVDLQMVPDPGMAIGRMLRRARVPIARVVLCLVDGPDPSSSASVVVVLFPPLLPLLPLSLIGRKISQLRQLNCNN